MRCARRAATARRVVGPTRVPARTYVDKPMKQELARLREQVFGQERREREAHKVYADTYRVGPYKLRIPHTPKNPTPNWLGFSKKPITYDKGRCKVLYMNDLAHANVLNPDMLIEMHGWLRRYEDESERERTTMIIRGSGTRFFSTGYDMKLMCDAAIGAARPTAEQDRAKLQQRREQFAKAFAENEEFQGDAVTAADTGRSGVRAHTMAGLHLAHQVFYSNYFIMTMVNGLCTGSGAAFLHAPIVIATEASVFSAPYCEVGWFPDCGITKVLASLPNHLGYYLALTGARLTGADLYHAGLASHYIAHHSFPVLKQALDTVEDREDYERIFLLMEACSQSKLPPFSLPPEQLEVIKNVFSLPSIERILATLDEMQTGFSIATATRIRKNSPIATKVTFELLKRAVDLPFSKVLEADWQAAYRLARYSDVKEGLRSWVQGDDCPRWQWPRIENIPKEEVDLCLSPLPAAYSYKPINEKIQSSLMHIEVEGNFLDFSKSWHRFATHAEPPSKLWIEYLSAANYYGQEAAIRYLERNGYKQFESFEDRRLAFGNAERIYEEVMPYRPSPWAQRLDVQQRFETWTLFENERMEREKAEAKKSLDEFKDSFFKATGKELTLLNEEENSEENPNFIDPEAHQNYYEELMERHYDGQIDVLQEDSYKDHPDPITLRDVADIERMRIPRFPHLF